MGKKLLCNYRQGQCSQFNGKDMVRAGAPSFEDLWMSLRRHSCYHFLSKCPLKYTLWSVVRIAALPWERRLTLVREGNFLVGLHISFNLWRFWMCVSVVQVSNLFKRLIYLICTFLFSETGLFNICLKYFSPLQFIWKWGIFSWLMSSFGSSMLW